MAAFPARDRTAHAAHWQKVLAHDSNVARTIVDQGQVVGYIGSWDADGQRLVGYWIGRDHWGAGLPRAPSPTSSPRSPSARCMPAWQSTIEPASACSSSAASTSWAPTSRAASRYGRSFSDWTRPERGPVDDSSMPQADRPTALRACRRTNVSVPSDVGE